MKKVKRIKIKKVEPKLIDKVEKITKSIVSLAPYIPSPQTILTIATALGVSGSLYLKVFHEVYKGAHDYFYPPPSIWNKFSSFFSSNDSKSNSIIPKIEKEATNEEKGFFDTFFGPEGGKIKRKHSKLLKNKIKKSMINNKDLLIKKPEKMITTLPEQPKSWFRKLFGGKKIKLVKKRKR